MMSVLWDPLVACSDCVRSAPIAKLLQKSHKKSSLEMRSIKPANFSERRLCGLKPVSKFLS